MLRYTLTCYISYFAIVLTKNEAIKNIWFIISIFLRFSSRFIKPLSKNDYCYFHSTPRTKFWAYASLALITRYAPIIPAQLIHQFSAPLSSRIFYRRLQLIHPLSILISLGAICFFVEIIFIFDNTSFWYDLLTFHVHFISRPYRFIWRLDSSLTKRFW